MFTIRTASRDHVPTLIQIEKAAAEIFSTSDLPVALRQETVSPQTHLKAIERGHLLVALRADRDQPVGYALLAPFDRYLHLLQMDVHPSVQRRGIGAELLDRIFTLGTEGDFKAVSLTTFEHIRWNAPWYEKHGFCIIEEADLPPFVAAILAKERGRGLRRRVAMRRDLVSQ